MDIRLMLQKGWVLGTLYFLSVLWIFLFPLVCISTGEMKPRGTYLSENALMPGSNGASFGEAARKRAAFLADEIHRSPLGVTAAMADKLRWLGLETDVRGNSSVHGVYRPVPGSDRKETCVVVVPFACSEMPPIAPCTGIGLVLALIQVLQEVGNWQSKNLVVLGAQSGAHVRDWLEDYHGNTAMARAGVIRGAVVLDFNGRERISGCEDGDLMSGARVGVLAPGANGQLPNLDLVNTIVRVMPPTLPPLALDRYAECDTFSRLRATAAELVAPLDSILSSQDLVRRVYLPRLETLLRFMQRVAFGPTGWHAHFVAFNIDAVTLARIDGAPSTPGSYVTFEIEAMRIVEQVLHSISNLEEKFHQSYFLYVLPSPTARLFVSIGEYAGPLVLLVLPLLATALSMQDALAPCGSVEAQGNGRVGAERGQLDGLTTALAIFSSAVVAGLSLLFLANSGELIRNLLFFARPLLDRDIEDSDANRWLIAYGTIYLCVVGTAWYTLHGASCRTVWRVLKTAMLLWLFVAHAALGILNFPLAMLSALCFVPCAVTVRWLRGTNAPGRLGSFLRLLLWALNSLPTLLLAVHSSAVELEFWGGSLDEAGGAIVRGAAMLLHAHRAEAGLMHLTVVCLVHMPSHVLCLVLLIGPFRDDMRPPLGKEARANGSLDR